MDAARATRHPLDDPDIAARIAEGAAAAIAAVARFATEPLHEHEPADFAVAVSALAVAERPRDAATDRAAAHASPGAPRTAVAGDTLVSLGLVEVAALIASGELDSVEVTRAALARAHDAQQRLNCFIAIDDAGALSAAAAADAARAAGRPLGPLHGVPLAHKDLFDIEGRAASCGSSLPMPLATGTATILARLRAAGAVTIGTLNMAEFALGPVGDNAHFGRCRNAVNPAYVAGGSSSGSGAAVAACSVYGSIGSDTGGSVRIPASANGVVGIKPTWGRVSRHGGMRLSPSLDSFGPLARSVRDAARLLTIIAGADPLETTAIDHAVPDYERALAAGIEGVRIGVPANYFLDGVAADVRAAAERGLRALQAAGARVVEVEVPDADVYAELSRAVLYPEVTALHGSRLRAHAARYSPQVRVRASTGLAIPASTYCEALALRAPLLRRFCAQVFTRCDVLHTPTLAIPVPRYADVEAGSGPALWQMLAGLVRCTAPFNYLGLPALTVPSGCTDNGLPAGVQLVGRPFDEGLLLRVAAAHEARVAAGS
jgi:aspartyl-tRNA(Asn)/glutamyl-tRNA(Gln) amidotransferase subunit A